MPGANYTVTIDGIARVNHDVRETAIERASVPKARIAAVT
jgi:hypothetical protein